MTEELLAALEYRARTFGRLTKAEVLALIAEIRQLRAGRDDDEREAEALEQERKLEDENR